MKRLEDMSVLITGGGSGLGAGFQCETRESLPVDVCPGAQDGARGRQVRGDLPAERLDEPGLGRGRRLAPGGPDETVGELAARATPLERQVEAGGGDAVRRHVADGDRGQADS